SNTALRRALAGAARTQDLVWGTLGRFALPATGLIPPGILGHDPGRRQPHLPREKALEMIRTAGIPHPLRLRASIHPILLNQYAGLTQALFRIWADLGVEVEIATKTMPEFIDSWHPNRNFDVSLGRWIADYDDPDNFSFTLFHSGNGALREYFSSPETDRILEEARSEARPAAREALYRKFEHELLDPAIFVPLFHDVDYRIASPRVRGLQLRSATPYVNYAELGKAEAPATPATAERPAGGGTLQVPIAGVVRSIDPAACETQEQSEAAPCLFETLMRAIEGTRIVPWLASEVLTENEGRRYRFRLRPGVFFHDGRRLTSRDVRYSWERLLLNPSVNRWLLSTIRGAKRLLEGEAVDLEGFHIVSPTEFFIDLEKPVSFFPAVISYTPTAVVPEGIGAIGSSSREGAVGTGPFRLVRFEPGRRLELERNPHYWREGYPRSDGLVFRFGVSPEEVRSEFLAGRLSLASDLLPADAEAFRHDPRFASGYREDPSLVTYFIAFNRLRGPLQDLDLRRSLSRAVDVDRFVRRTLGRLFIPAHGVIPPGLLGYSASGPDSGPVTDAPAASDSSVEATVSRETIELTANVHPVFFGELSAFYRELTEAFREIGFRIRSINRTMAEYLELQRAGEGDMSVGRWTADYADADNFVHTLLHSDAGFFGKYVGGTEINELAERGRAETDPRVRHAIYRQVEELSAREALILPLFYAQVYCFARPEVAGLGSLGSNPIVSYENLWIRR
ncbi:MAG: ABC transporter substrate-binding protein, partial [Thermoanaerobaculia bacterium]